MQYKIRFKPRALKDGKKIRRWSSFRAGGRWQVAGGRFAGGRFAGGRFAGGRFAGGRFAGGRLQVAGLQVTGNR